MPHIVVFTGPAASGKNTIAHLHATEQRECCAVIDTDRVRWMLRNLHVTPWSIDPHDAPAQVQHQLGIKGFDVIICDVAGDRPLYDQQRVLTNYDTTIDNSDMLPHGVAAWISKGVLHE